LSNIIDITKEFRNVELQEIHQEIERTELGLRAICIMYDEHSNDPNSRKNIFNQKSNIYYKLSSIRFQFKIFIEQIFKAEIYIKELEEKDPNKLKGFLMGNPYFEKIEVELSSVFDNIVFNSVSIFDYISHIICYVCKNNKQKTEYWSSLIKSAHGRNNEISDSQISVAIKHVEKNLVGKLNDYRSRLIHKKRDRHTFQSEVEIVNGELNHQICLAASKVLLSKKYLGVIRNDFDEDEHISLTIVASWLIKNTMHQIEFLLEGLVFHIKDNSHYIENLNVRKRGKGFMSGMANPITKRIIKMSDVLYFQYKKKNLKWMFPDKELKNNAV
jgi:hypothetical protein